MARLLIVSNRLPVSTRLEEGQLSVVRSAGGLATGLRGPHEQSGGLWLGWPGDTDGLTPEQLAELERQLEDLRAVPCYLTAPEVAAYYNRLANGVLWPLFHYLLDRIPYHARDWETYRSVNQRFAGLVTDHYQAGDSVWIQDYQLMLLPAMLRETLPDARIGFFLHIPFPATEVLRIFPWREELLQGLLGADLLGFHTLSYARHFGNSLIHILGLTPEAERVRYGGRQVRFGAYPMGIDFADFERLAASPEVEVEAARIREQNGDVRLLLGVDRLDYTKGIPRRLLAMERLLQLEPDFRGRVRLLQVAVPSRTDVEEYATFTAQVNQLVGRINGEFGSPTSTPIHYLHRSFTQQELVALYRAADVMLVTPLRDGMNLVAKEFVASRPDEDGVLVLSEFAGAAAEMGEALLVNPYDIDAMASTMRLALGLPKSERAIRMRALRKRVRRFDVHRWAGDFLSALEAPAAYPGDQPRALSRDERTAILRRVSEAKQVLLLLDYDGTLAPFQLRPELARPDGALLELLGSLAAAGRFDLHIVSGRARETLDEWLGMLPVGLHAEHGMWSRLEGGTWKLNAAIESAWKPQALSVLEQFVSRTPGSLIEEKTHSLAWHYRMCDPEYGEWQARELKIHLAHALSNVPVAVLAGNKVVELQPHGVHKGSVATALCEAAPGALVIAAGDDETDENLFSAVPPEAVTIRVGSRPSKARFSLPDHRAMRRFLQALAAVGP